MSKVEIPYAYIDDKTIPPDYIDAAKQLVSKDYFNCFSCHQQGDKKPEGPVDGWAPDLTLARQRLNPNWILKWLKDPQKVQPGTKMPSFYPGGPDNILGGKEDLQIEALRDYLDEHRSRRCCSRAGGSSFSRKGEAGKIVNN